MQLLGATVIEVDSGSRTLKDATNEAMRDWMGSVGKTHYIIGSVVGPHPFPMMVRDFQSVIGRECRAQCLEKLARLPDAVVACVGVMTRQRPMDRIVNSLMPNKSSDANGVTLRAEFS